MRRVFAVVTVIGVLAAPVPLFAQVQSAQDRAALQAQLDKIEQEIAQNQGSLTELQQQRTTLERDIQILDNKIKTAQLQIKQTDLTLSKIGTDISAKQAAINQIDAKVAKGKESVAQILRHTREIDDTSLVQLVLSESLTDFFRDIDDFQQVQGALDSAFTQFASTRADLSASQNELQDKQTEAQQIRTAQTIAKQQVQNDEAQKQSILTTTKGQEQGYQQLIADKQKQAAAIRQALFGLRDSGAIPFGTAYEYAKDASKGTGVSPALILAILTQESNLGVNIGSCYVTNLGTGAGVGKNTGRAFSNVMKAPRDTVPFQQITEALSRDWSNTAVSCPQGVGYGGAMGPAQFIASTWILYKPRLSALTGESMPDPWSARTAVFATALLMKDNGADGGTRTAERTAALRYFAGGNWSNPANASYGDSVMDLRDNIQGQIDIIASAGS
jgi:membrane-bound lytic murein transglycosylase B